jgi:putative hydrolase of the HAD superfamily
MTSGAIGRPVSAVCFDLDDTLFPQAAWLAGAWAAVAHRAAGEGVDPSALRAALDDIAAEGSDRGRIIDRALARVGARDIAVAPLVEAFRTHRVDTLEPYPGVRRALAELGSCVPLGLVSDGDPMLQKGKLAALDLDTPFRAVVWSDEHGREHRKPDPLPFRVAVEQLGCQPDEVVFVGDRPDKDVAGACAAGLRAIRVRTGEWRRQPDDDRAWASVATIVDACAVLRPALVRQPVSTSTSTRNSNSPGANR